MDNQNFLRGQFMESILFYVMIAAVFFLLGCFVTQRRCDNAKFDAVAVIAGAVFEGRKEEITQPVDWDYMGDTSYLG